MKLIVMSSLALISGLMLGGCAKHTTPPPIYSGSGYPNMDASTAAQYPLRYGSMPTRSHEGSVPDEGVSGFPEGHPLAPTTMPKDSTSVHMQPPSTGMGQSSDALGYHNSYDFTHD